MARRIDSGDGFTVLDGAVLVIGSAVAAVHVRVAARPADGLDPMGWALLWMILIGVALTATGPIVFVIRGIGRRSGGYPQTGDTLWAVLGLPWLFAAPVRDQALGSSCREAARRSFHWHSWRSSGKLGSPPLRTRPGRTPRPPGRRRWAWSWPSPGPCRPASCWR